MTKAQGQEITKNVRALYTQLEKEPSTKTKGGITAIISAAKTTIGVYQRANLVINCSTLALLEEAFSTKSKIFATVDSPYSLVT